VLAILFLAMFPALGSLLCFVAQLTLAQGQNIEVFGEEQVLYGELRPTNLGVPAQFGSVLASSVDALAAGIPGADSVNLFVKSTGTSGEPLVLSRRLSPPAEGNSSTGYGESIALSSLSSVAVAAPRENKVFIYNNWDIIQTLSPTDVFDNVSFAGFGTAVAMNARYLVIGSPEESCIYVYELEVSQTWALLQKLCHPLNENFGSDLALDEVSSMVVASRKPESGDPCIQAIDAAQIGINLESTFCYSYRGSSPVALAIDSSKFLCGLAHFNNFAGTVVVVNKADDGTWERQGTFLFSPNEEQEDELFGAAVDIEPEDGAILISATRMNSTPSSTGSIGYVFRYDTRKSWYPWGGLVPLDSPPCCTTSGAVKWFAGFAAIGSPDAENLESGVLLIFDPSVSVNLILILIVVSIQSIGWLLVCFAGSKWAVPAGLLFSIPADIMHAWCAIVFLGQSGFTYIAGVLSMCTLVLPALVNVALAYRELNYMQGHYHSFSIWYENNKTWFLPFACLTTPTSAETIRFAWSHFTRHCHAPVTAEIEVNVAALARIRLVFSDFAQFMIVLAVSTMTSAEFWLTTSTVELLSFTASANCLVCARVPDLSRTDLQNMADSSSSKSMTEVSESMEGAAPPRPLSVSVLPDHDL